MENGEKERILRTSVQFFAAGTWLATASCHLRTPLSSAQQRSSPVSTHAPEDLTVPSVDNNCCLHCVHPTDRYWETCDRQEYLDKATTRTSNSGLR